MSVFIQQPKNNKRLFGVMRKACDLIVVMSVLLYGCYDQNETQKHPEKIKVIQELSQEQFVLPKPVLVQPLREERKVPEEYHIPLTEEGFPNASNLIMEERAALLRGERQRMLEEYKKNNNEIIQSSFSTGNTTSYVYKDKNYQIHGKLPQDESTFPVDRSRIITTDMNIVGVLANSINSQIPGKIIIVVEQDVLSSTMEYVLLPAYTKIICLYQGLEKNGQTRLPIQCVRAIRPDGTSISMTNAHAADLEGKMGLIGSVDHRTWEKYGSSFLIASLSALSQISHQALDHRIVGQLVNSISNPMAQVTAKFLEQNF